MKVKESTKHFFTHFQYEKQEKINLIYTIYSL